MSCENVNQMICLFLCIHCTKKYVIKKEGNRNILSPIKTRNNRKSVIRLNNSNLSTGYSYSVLSYPALIFEITVHG